MSDRVFLCVALIAVGAGVFLDNRVDWFPAFLAGLLLGIAAERRERRRLR